MAFAQMLELYSRKRGTYTAGPSESITACRLMLKGVRSMSSMMMRQPIYGLLAAAAVMTACAASPQSEPTTAPPAATPAPSPVALAPFPPSGHAAMDAWRDDFAARAVAAGRDPALVPIGRAARWGRG